MGDDRRGDAYMNGMMPATATCPWVPVIGNHESSDGDHYNRFLNQTWGEAYANPALVSSTADTALGHLLSKGTLFGASTGVLDSGDHGNGNATTAGNDSAPSGTSRYFSVDIGLVHMVGLDLNAPETTPRTIGLDGKQLAWLAQDLAAADANRANVPWVVVTSHFPIYIASSSSAEGGAAGAEAGGGGRVGGAGVGAAGVVGEGGEITPVSGPTGGSDEASAEYYLSIEAEDAAVGSEDEYRTCVANGEKAGCKTVGQFKAEAASKLEPLFILYGVDLYGAGHQHAYGGCMYLVRRERNRSGPASTDHYGELTPPFHACG